MKTSALLPILMIFLFLQSCSPDVLDDINDSSRPVVQHNDELPADIQQQK